MNVKIYIETTLAGPVVLDGKYSAIVEFIKKTGEPVTREIYGEEEATTWHRSTLLAAVKAIKVLTKPCEVELITQSSFVANMVNGGKIENWKRSEWKKASGQEIKNKELWQEFAEQMERHKIRATFCKHHEYQQYLQEAMRRKPCLKNSEK